MYANRLEQIISNSLCVGCGLCTSILGPGRAEMSLNNEGYNRPTFHEDLTLYEDLLISRVCPGATLDFEKGTSEHDVFWGPIESIHRGFAVDEELRFRASSGGAISAIAAAILNSGHCDYVLQIGANLHSPWETQLSESRHSGNIEKNCGSRYVTSSPLIDIVQRLDRNERFVVVGKPCDIAALRMYGRYDERINSSIVAMLSFMCGGVSSVRGAEALLEKMGVSPNNVTDFRYRGYGWPGLATASLLDGSSRTLTYKESWGQILNRYVQFRCKICPDGIGVFADIVCADAWIGTPDGYPSFEEAPGISAIISRTHRGKEYLDLAVSSKSLRLAPLTTVELEAMQPFQVKRKQITLSRLAAMIVVGRKIPRYKGLFLLHHAMRAGLIANFRSFFGMLRRIKVREPISNK